MPGLDNLTGELHQTFKEEVIPKLHNLFQKVEKERTLCNSFSEAISNIKPEKDMQETTIITYDYRLKIFSKILAKLSLKLYKKNYAPLPCRVHPRI